MVGDGLPERPRRQRIQARKPRATAVFAKPAALDEALSSAFLDVPLCYHKGIGDRALLPIPGPAKMPCRELPRDHMHGSKRTLRSGMRTITKKELVNRIADQTSVTKVVAKEIIQSFLDAIIDELAAGNRLEFREFGVFETKERAARRAQNPRTLEKVSVPAKRIVKFKVGRLMRTRVSGDDDAASPATSPQAAVEQRNDPPAMSPRTADESAP